jgi:hypothetical protein
MLKTAPHFGHLTFASFDTDAHPNEKTAKIANAMKMLTNFLITYSLLLSTDTTDHHFGSRASLEDVI